jgi:hypothetical protein
MPQREAKGANEPRWKYIIQRNRSIKAIQGNPATQNQKNIENRTKRTLKTATNEYDRQ